MTTFTYSVSDNFFPQVFTGTQEATSKEELYNELVEVYTMELDTVESELTITIEEVETTNNTKQEVIYEAAKDTAKKIRVSLKSNFPGIKFSVRSSVFAGGDSVDVSWTDGPLYNEVETILNQFKSGHFDGMEDIYVSGAYSYEGKLYNGAKYVMGQRNLSNEYRQQIKEYIANNYEDANENTWEYNRIFNEAEKEMLKGDQSEVVETIEESEEVVSVPEVDNVEQLTVELIINEDKNGIELKFSGKPNKGTRELIKENGFKWSSFKSVWYTKQSDKALLFSESFVSAFNDIQPEEQIEVSEPVEVESETLVNDSALVGRKVLGNWGSAGFNYGIITSENVYNEVVVKWEDNEDGLTESTYNINELINHNTIDCIGIHLLEIETELNNKVEEVTPIEPTTNITESILSDKKPSNVIDFTSRFKQRQEAKGLEKMSSRFLNDILPNMDQSDKTKLIEACQDENKFSEVLQDILIKVSFKQALNDSNKG